MRSVATEDVHLLNSLRPELDLSAVEAVLVGLPEKAALGQQLGTVQTGPVIRQSLSCAFAC